MTEEFTDFLNDFIQKSRFSNREHLPAFWIEAEVALARIPDKYVWPVESSDKVALWVTDTTSLNTWYWGDIVKRINATLFFQSSKFKTLLEGIARAAVENNLLTLTLLMRSLFENCATLYDFGTLIERRLNGFDCDSLTKSKFVDKAFEDELIIFSHGSRFNWRGLLSGDLDAWINAPDDVKPEHKQKNVMTRIHRVAAEKRYGAFELLYAWLCDYVHPNLGSHMLFVLDERALEDGSIRMELGRSVERDHTINLLEPFTGGILSCLEIISKKTTAVVNVTEPVGHWCREHYIQYVRKAGTGRN